MNKNFIQQIKCLFIILFISCFCLSTWGELHAQNPKLTLKFRDAGMEQIMNEIEKQINYYFIVDKGVDIKRTSRSMSLPTKPLTAVLDQLVAGTDTRYRVYQQNIYLSVVKRDASKPVRISGKVIDARANLSSGPRWSSGARRSAPARASTAPSRCKSPRPPRRTNCSSTSSATNRPPSRSVRGRPSTSRPRIRRADRRSGRHGPRPHPQGKSLGYAVTKLGSDARTTPFRATGSTAWRARSPD